MLFGCGLPGCGREAKAALLEAAAYEQLVFLTLPDASLPRQVAPRSLPDASLPQGVAAWRLPDASRLRQVALRSLPDASLPQIDAFWSVMTRSVNSSPSPTAITGRQKSALAFAAACTYGSDVAVALHDQHLRGERKAQLASLRDSFAPQGVDPAKGMTCARIAAT